MADKLEGRSKEIIEGKNYAHVSVPRKDGTVQSVIVWAHTEGDNVTLNSAEGRAWPANVRRAGTATVTAMADGNPYEYVSITGTLEEATREGADDHIDALAKKYIDEDVYPFRQPGEERIKLVLKPERISYVKQG